MERTCNQDVIVQLPISSFTVQTWWQIRPGLPSQRVQRAKQFNLHIGQWPKTWWGEEESAVFVIFVICCSVHSQIHHLEYTAGIQAE